MRDGRGGLSDRAQHTADAGISLRKRTASPYGRAVSSVASYANVPERSDAMTTTYLAVVLVGATLLCLGLTVWMGRIVAALPF